MNFTYSTNIQRSIITDYGCPPEKVKCIYAGSNVPHDKEPELNNDNYQNKNIIFVGVYWERKGGPDLVKAFEKVLKVHPDAKLTIVGCSPSVDIPNCNVVGKVKVEELDNYYLNSSIFCLPTKREPFGIVFIEAMMHKLPIVSNRIGALPDFVTDDKNGFLVEPGNSDQLAEVLIRMLNDPEMCKRFGEAGYELVEDHYTWDRVGQRLKENITPFLH
jgi:glycosyltransferase involved in cell wall biosynthesis